MHSPLISLLMRESWIVIACSALIIKVLNCIYGQWLISVLLLVIKRLELYKKESVTIKVTLGRLILITKSEYSVLPIFVFLIDSLLVGWTGELGLT
jgi:hypothetical protein